MDEIIKARVWTKVDTLEAWDANPLILGPGEAAFVVTPSGAPVNFKLGDGTKTFSQLPWYFDAIAKAGFFGSASPSDSPNPDEGDGFWIVSESGEYANFGGVSLPDNSYGFITRIGTDYAIIVSDVNLAGYVSKSEITSVPVYSQNYFDTGTIVSNSLVNSTGGLQAASGWKRIDIDYTGLIGQTLVVEGVQVGSIYSSFYDAAKTTMVKFNGSHPSDGSAKNCFTNSPSAAWFIMSIKRPEDPDSIYANITVRTVTGEVVTQIEGKDLKGGLSVQQSGGTQLEAERIIFDGATVTDEGGKTVRVSTPPPYDQSLNKADSVEFGGVTAGSMDTSFLTATGVSLNIPVWDETGTPPIPVGGIYILPDGTMKRRMS